MIEAPFDLQGKMLDCRQDGHCQITVWQNDVWRWLEFLQEGGANSAIQSIVHRKQLHSLAFPYVQALCLSLCCVTNDRPAILQFGLGGGAINRFLFAHKLAGSLLTVERSQVVHELCREHFRLPEYDVVEIGSAENWLSARAGGLQAGKMDIVICDLFWQSKLPECMLTKEFFAMIGVELGEAGILAINLPYPESVDTQYVFAAVRASFSYLQFLPLNGYDNVIVLACRKKITWDSAQIRKLNKLLTLDVEQVIGRSVLVD